MGKGSAPRPIVDRKQYESEWERIFASQDMTIVTTLEKSATPIILEQKQRPNEVA